MSKSSAFHETDVRGAYHWRVCHLGNIGQGMALKTLTGGVREHPLQVIVKGICVPLDFLRDQSFP